MFGLWMASYFVAHDKEDVNPDRTLESLYLEPLLDEVKKNGGSVYPGYEHEFILWIDIKSEGVETYQAIHKELRKYQKMLTRYTTAGVKPGAVTVYISGNRPRDVMETQKVRYAAYDGRMSDFDRDVTNEFIPIISDNWTKHFTWMGVGEMPNSEKEKLKQSYLLLMKTAKRSAFGPLQIYRVSTTRGNLDTTIERGCRFHQHR